MIINLRAGVWGVLALSLLGVSMPSFAGQGTVIDASLVQQQLLLNRATWQAKTTWVSELSVQKAKRMLGLKDAPNTDAQFSTLSQNALFSRVKSDKIDWRSNAGQNWLTPILNQGNCGSCVAFASVATLDSQFNISRGIFNLNRISSPQALFACGGGGCDTGWWPESAANYLERRGVPDEACAPYTMGVTGQDVSCSSICKDSSSRSLKILQTMSPTKSVQSIEAVKDALKHGPLVTTLLVYADFLTYSKGVYKHVTGDALGGHAVSIVGFDDAKKAWLIRNSWGEEWGDKGFAYVSYDDISGVSNDTWSYEVSKSKDYVTVRNPVNNTYAWGTAPVEVETSFAAGLPVTVQVKKEAKIVWESTCSERPSCQIDLQTEKLADGRYDIAAFVNKGEEFAERSAHQLFYVSNNVAKNAELSFKAHGFAPESPVKGRIEFDINANFDGIVPFRSLTFHVSKNGVEVASRKTDTVLPSMVLGWRTPTVTNGTYEIWFSAETFAAGKADTLESEKLSLNVQNK